MFLKNLYYFFKVCGLATIYVDSKYLDKNKLKYLTFMYSKESVVYNIFLITLIVIMNIFSLKYIYTVKVIWMIQFDRLSQIILILALVLSSSIILVIYCIKQSEMIKIGNKLNIIVDSLMNLRNDKKNDEPSIEYIVKIVCFVNIFTWTTIFLMSFLSGDPFEYNIGIIMSSFFINWTVIQYSAILILIFNLFRLINLRFQRIFEKPELIKNVSFILDYKHGNKSVNTKISQFFQLRSLFLTLHSVTRDLSNFYALPMLLSIFSIFITLILYLYYSTKTTLWEMNANIPLMAYINSFSWTFLYIYTLVVITRSASLTVSEV